MGNDSVLTLLKIDAELFNETKADKEKRLTLTKSTERLTHVQALWFGMEPADISGISEDKALFQMQRLLHKNRKKLTSIALALDEKAQANVMEAIQALSKETEVLEEASLKNKKSEENVIMENQNNTGESTKDLLAKQLAGQGAGAGVNNVNAGVVDGAGALPQMDGDNSSIKSTVDDILKGQEASAAAFTKGNIISGLLVKKRPISERLTSKAEDYEIEIAYDKLADMRAAVIEKSGAEFETDVESGVTTLTRVTKSPASELANVQHIVGLLDEALKNVDTPFRTKMYVADPTYPIVGFLIQTADSTNLNQSTKDEMQMALLNKSEGYLESKDGSVQVNIKLLSGKTAKKKRQKLDESVSKGETVSNIDAVKTITGVGVSADDKKNKEKIMVFMSEVSQTETEFSDAMKSALSFKYYGSSGRTNSKGQKIATTMRLTGKAVLPLKKTLEQDAAYAEKFPVSAGINATKTPEENKKALTAALAAVTEVATTYGIKGGEGSLVDAIVAAETAKEAASAASAASDV